MIPRVVDTSHHNTVNDLSATATAGVWAVIHKASQGSNYRDPDYAKRREMARSAGLLWGAYHFNDGSSVTQQVTNFLAAAQPDDETLLVLDFEDNPKSNMSIQDAVKFLRLLFQRTGRLGTIYSGNRLKENIGKLSQDDRTFVCLHKLWLCQYGPTAKLPEGFTQYFLWQFTDGQVGPQPHSIAGISGNGIDLNHYAGTVEELRELWVYARPEGTVDDNSDAQSSHAADAAQDAEQDAFDAPFSPLPRPPVTAQPNVRPQTALYDVAVEVVQKRLDGFGYHEVGNIDGKSGGKLVGAIKAFFNDRGVVGLASMDSPLLLPELSKATQEGWTRPIAPERANATAEELAPKVESVRVNLQQKFGAKVVAVVSGLGFTGSTISSAFTDVQSKLQPVHDAFAKIPPEIWFGVVGLTAASVFWATDKAAKATTKDFNTGRLN